MSEYTETWLEGPGSTSFYTRLYSASSPKAVLVFVHGFAEHIGRFAHVHPRFAQAGITVFTYDQRGFGNTGLNKEHKSKSSAYGKTTWPEQLADIEWAVKHAKQTVASDGLPIFLMGHSMGGGLCLAFPTRESSPPEKSTVDLLSAIIVTSPLIEQAKPASKIKRWIGGKLASVSPSTLIPADVKPEDLSHDPKVGEEYLKDPLVKTSGSLRGISDMLAGGEVLLSTNFKFWPESLPVLFIHGTEDKVTSHTATEAFSKKIPSKDKTVSLYPGGFHELHNEPDGVKEKMTDECIAFILARATTSAKL